MDCKEQLARGTSGSEVKWHGQDDGSMDREALVVVGRWTSHRMRSGLRIWKKGARMNIPPPPVIRESGTWPLSRMLKPSSFSIPAISLSCCARKAAAGSSSGTPFPTSRGAEPNMSNSAMVLWARGELAMVLLVGSGAAQTGHP